MDRLTAAANITELQSKLVQRFGDNVRPGDEGLFVPPQLLAEVAAFIATSPGFDFNFLDMITAVDRDDNFELIYAFINLKVHQRLVLRTVTPRSQPCVPSIRHLWLGADFQEREIFDLFGIRFEGHPDLRRIVLWEGYAGHPLRKDFHHDA